ncbi:MAG TPA: hypothetical protein VGS27_24265 [Candidatus Sulfotelmatobacter sp.]|nr:hypothetical protein [Candidatus Sulfotelmatobacter sp.]
MNQYQEAARRIVILRRALFARRRTWGSHRAASRFLRRNKREATFLIGVLLTISSVFASAQTLTGTVKNATTGKPGAGDEVILITLGQGMEEAGRTKADAKGNFSFKLDNQGPHLIRVIHEDVTYHRMAPPGTTSVEVEVYDASKKVDGIEVIADIMRFQAGNGTMQIERTFAVQNNSKPPRTQNSEHNLEFYVPDGAKIEEAQAMTAGGQPVKSAPVPNGDNAKNRYSFLFPLRPGESRFEVVYTIPYTGSINIDPKLVYPLEHFVAIAPKAMQFAPANADSYKSTPFPGQPDANVEVASNVQVGQPMAFKLTGEGELAAPADENGQSQGGGGQQADNRPGGGLGPPTDAPPPLQKYQWWIIGGFAAVLIIGGVIVASRQQAAHRAARTKPGLSTMEEAEDFEIPVRSAGAAQAVAEAPRLRTQASSKLLEGLKEELFELEVEHKQGRISQQEYEKTKAALDQTLQRALKRESQKA